MVGLERLWKFCFRRSYDDRAALGLSVRRYHPTTCYLAGKVACLFSLLVSFSVGILSQRWNVSRQVGVAGFGERSCDELSKAETDT